MTETTHVSNNRHRIFDYIYQSTVPVTKQALADALKLSLPTVTNYLSELMALGILTNAETGLSTGGRKPRTFSIVAQSQFAIGVSINEKNVCFIAIDLFVTELAYHKAELQFVDTDAYYQQIASLVDQFARENHLAQHKILGVGITFPGIVKEESDTLEYAHRLQLREKKLSDIRKHFSHKVHFMNDANASGFAEWWYRPEDETNVYLSIDHGVGGSIMVKSHCYLGDNGRSAEFGHICIEPNGALCSCGRQGCLEAYCSTAKISDDLQLSLDDFFQKLAKGDAYIVKRWDDYLQHLAQGIINIRAVLDCNIILSGRLAPYMEPYMTKLHALISTISPFDYEKSYIQLSRFRSRSANVGCALYFVDHFINQI